MIKSDFKILSQILVSGAVWAFTETIAYQSTDYDLIIKLKKTNSAVMTLTATAGESGSFVFNITALNTSALSKGWHTAQVVVYNKGTQEIADLLNTDVFIEKLLTDSEDVRTENEIILDNIVAVLKNSSTREQGVIGTPGGTSITYRTLTELSDIKDKYQARVNRERQIKSGEFKRTEGIYL